MNLKTLLQLSLTVLLTGIVQAAPLSVSDTTTLISTALDGTPRSGSVSSVSANGRFVTFHSIADDLINGDNNRRSDIFVHDRQNNEIERVSLTNDGNEGNGGSFFPAISGDGRFVVFSSEASNLVVGDSNERLDIFVYDRQTGTTQRVSVASDGEQANDHCFSAVISGDGSRVCFHVQC